MTPEDVRQRVEAIKVMAADDQIGHSEEDRLYHDVLVDIADCDCHAADLARQAIKTKEIDFARWYA